MFNGSVSAGVVIKSNTAESLLSSDASGSTSSQFSSNVYPADLPTWKDQVIVKSKPSNTGKYNQKDNNHLQEKDDLDATAAVGKQI